MLRALLYDTNRHELKLLEGAELLQSAPLPEETERKNASADGSTLRAGKTYCREGEFVWVDATNPDEDDYKILSQRFDLHPMVLDDLREHQARPKIHDYEDYFYLVFYAIEFAAVQKSAGRADFALHEIDCLFGPDYVVTIHNTRLQPFEDLRARWEKHPQLMKSGPPYLLYELMDEVLDDYFPALEKLDKYIDHIENHLFDKERKGDQIITAEIFALKRDLLQIRHVAGPTRDVANILLRHDTQFGGRHFAYFQDLFDHASRIVDLTDTFREVLSGALDAFFAVEGNRMNTVMKTLTSASIMLLVPNLIAATYGMNFMNMPELKTRNGYFIVLGVMAMTMIALYAMFKRKGWL